jgi:glycine betaine/proline transport system substrate-binding protein
MTDHRATTAARALAAGLVLSLAAAAGGAADARAQDGEIRVGMQPWPGVTVKSQVAQQILEAIGYPTQIKELSPQFVYQGMKSGDVDVTLGAWMPAHKSMVQPLVEAGEVREYAINLEGAIQGLAVPTYVCESGVQSVADLVANAERFDRTIYAIGAGAAMTEAFSNAVKNDVKGLGDWTVTPSSVSGMLSQVERKTRDEEAVVFHGWKPHWMAVKFDICFLEDDADSEIAGLETEIWTITASGWAERHPQAAKFLKQFRVSPETQSRWIYEYSYEETPAEKVAASWLAGQPEQLSAWLDGVEAADGTPALKKLEAATTN